MVVIELEMDCWLSYANKSRLLKMLFRSCNMSLVLI